MGQQRLLSLRHVPFVTRVVMSIIMLVAGFGIMSLLVATRVEAGRVDPDRGLTVVPVFTSQLATVQRPWQGYGRAEALNRSRVPARISSVVETVPADLDAGVAVEKGQLLVKLDEDDFAEQAEADQQEIERQEAELRQLEIEEKRLVERIDLIHQDLEIAVRQEERLRSLQERRSANVADVDRVERETLAIRRDLVVAQESLDRLPQRRQALQANIKAARARQSLSKLNVERARVTSPIGGVLSVYDVKVGESVSPGQTLAEVVDLTVIEVPVRLPAGSRGTFRPGDTVQLVATSDEHRHWTGRIDRIAPNDDPDTRTLTAYVVVEQPDADPDDPETLPPGLFVSARVDARPIPDALVVPRRAVRAGRLFVVEGDHLVSRAVEIDFTVDGHPLDLPIDEWVVLHGHSVLSDGERVVTEASSLLKDGLRVDPRPIGERTTTDSEMREEPAP